MELGRNINQDKASGRFYLAFKWAGENKVRQMGFETHRQAVRKFNQLKVNANWLPIQEDITI